MKRWRILAIKNREMRAIKAHKSSGGANPKISIGGLRKCLDSLLRQSVRRLPYAPRVSVKAVGPQGRATESACEQANGKPAK
jgi:hypothetical protein